METKQVTSDKSKRLIDAMQLVTKLAKRVSVLILLGAKASEIYDEVLKVIAEAPTEDAAPVVHGQWICRPDLCSLLSIPEAYVCSECGKSAIEKHNFCNRCGAAMDKKEETNAPI